VGPPGADRDLVLTGTPAGVGMGRGRQLIESVGELSHTIR
jgi:2-keto-4-pentenoate hydratase/2-oxohepta-3-ene-1,7-dioic acid hydratase in catechol pathway